MNLIVKMKFGSHLYGTHTSTSDVDYKGVFLPRKQEVLLNAIPKCRSLSTGSNLAKNRPDDVDEEIYSLHHFIHMASTAQTVALDMLHAPEDMLIASSDIWRQVVSQKHRFYTKKLNSFVDYARRQASKYGIKGSRLDAALQVLAVLRAHPSKDRLRKIWHQLPRNSHCQDIDVDPNGLRQYQVCGKIIQESTAIGHVLPVIQRFYDDYGRRAKLAVQNKNIDWKAISHAFRATIQIKEIMESGTISYPLKDAPFLLDVKSGRLDYTKQVAPLLEALMEEVENIVNQSNLPERVDTDYWNRFICHTLESNLFKSGD